MSRMDMNGKIRGSLTGFCTAALLAGCSAATPSAPAVSTGQNASTGPIAQSVSGKIIQPPAELYKHAPFSLFASHQSPHTAHVPFLKDEAKRQGAQLLYASDYTNGVVDVFQQKVNGSLVGQYTGFAAPTGLASDGSSLYIADLEYESVFVFPFGNNATPSLILNDSGWLPWSVAVAPSGEVAVVNTSDVNANPGNVTFYKTGSGQPQRAVAETVGYWLDYGWYDSSGGFWYDASDQAVTKTYIEYIAPGAKSSQLIATIPHTNASGLTGASGGNFMVADLNTNQVRVFNSQGSQINLVNMEGATQILGINLGTTRARMFGVDATGYVLIDSWPTGQQIGTIGKGTLGYASSIISLPQSQ